MVCYAYPDDHTPQAISLRLRHHHPIDIGPPAAASNPGNLDSVCALLQIRIQRARAWISTRRDESDLLHRAPVHGYIGKALAAVPVEILDAYRRARGG